MLCIQMQQFVLTPISCASQSHSSTISQWVELGPQLLSSEVMLVEEVFIWSLLSVRCVCFVTLIPSFMPSYLCSLYFPLTSPLIKPHVTICQDCDQLYPCHLLYCSYHDLARVCRYDMNKDPEKVPAATAEHLWQRRDQKCQKLSGSDDIISNTVKADVSWCT